MPWFGPPAGFELRDVVAHGGQRSGDVDAGFSHQVSNLNFDWLAGGDCRRGGPMCGFDRFDRCEVCRALAWSGFLVLLDKRGHLIAVQSGDLPLVAAELCVCGANIRRDLVLGTSSSG